MKKDFIAAIFFIIFSVSVTQNTLRAYGEELDSYHISQNDELNFDDYFGWFKNCLNYEDTIRRCVRDNVQSALKGRPICCGIFKAFSKNCASKLMSYDYFMSFFRTVVDSCGHPTHHHHHHGSPKPPSPKMPSPTQPPPSSPTQPPPPSPSQPPPSGNPPTSPLLGPQRSSFDFEP
jgi:hypothetical protein